MAECRDMIDDGQHRKSRRPRDLGAALSQLWGLWQSHRGRRWALRNRSELTLDDLHGVRRIHIAHDDQRGVVRDIVGLVIGLEILWRDGLDISHPTDHRPM